MTRNLWREKYPGQFRHRWQLRCRWFIRRFLWYAQHKQIPKAKIEAKNGIAKALVLSTFISSFTNYFYTDQLTDIAYLRTAES